MIIKTDQNNSFVFNGILDRPETVSYRILEREVRFNFLSPTWLIGQVPILCPGRALLLVRW